MRKQYDGKLTMPESYNVVSNNDMEYLEGGDAIAYRRSYATNVGALAKAISFKKEKGYKKISNYDLAAEIYTHAVLYYNFGLGVWALSKLGYAKKYAEALLRQIDVIDGLDTKKEFGVKRYVIYRAFYAFGITQGI